jgi:hypothetical protein
LKIKKVIIKKSNKMTSTLITFQNEWRIYQVDDYEISELFIKNRIVCNSFVVSNSSSYSEHDNTTIYAVFMEDSSDANILCSNILKKNIYGSVIFIKVENTKLIDLCQNDINNILNILYNADSNVDNSNVDNSSNMIDNSNVDNSSNMIDNSNVDNLSNMIDNLEIEEDLHDDIYQTEYFAYFDDGYGSN